MFFKNINLRVILFGELSYYIVNNSFITMAEENNLEKSSQDYKKSQYGSWYKKSAENKKNIKEEKDNSFFKKLKKFFKN
tara:strand:- start:638 stop:874 length:237 start_codon:yes stop_codon:yes gene_type:complete